MTDAESESLNRVLQSPLFKKADRQSRFLRHVVEKHLAGQDDSLRETAIALEVYDRSPNYDPKTDPIVRVEASRLRSRLREYYETEGAEDALRIDIPKGSYVPTFQQRTPAADGAPAPVPEVPAVPLPQLWPVKWIAVAAAVTVLLAAAVYYFRASPVKAIDSVAVFPFADLSEKKDLAFAAAGLTEQIQDELARIRELRVVGSHSAAQAAANPDIRASARQIGVDAIIEGSVRTEAEKIRVNVRLVDGATGGKIWTGSFDGERTGLFALEERIAQAVAGKLSIQLEVRREGVDAAKAPQRAQAHEFYHQARELADRESSGPLDEVYRLYNLSAVTDPTYAPAQAGLAGVIVQSGSQLGGPGGKQRALEAAKKAIALDPNYPTGYSSLILYYRDAEMDRQKARAACTDYLKKFPNAPSLLSMCATIEGASLSTATQLELIRRAVAIDPLSARMHGGLMFALYQAGQFDEALSEADVAIKMGSKSNFLYRHRALILAAMGKPGEGLKVINDAEARFGGVPADWVPIRGYLLGLLKRNAEAEKLIRDFTRQGGLPHQLGLMQLGLGDHAKALNHFEQGSRSDPTNLMHAIPEYYMRTLDGEARFEAIKRNLRLVGQ